MLGFQRHEIGIVGGEYAVIRDLCIKRATIREVIGSMAISRRAALIERVINHRPPKEHGGQRMP